MIYKKEFLSYLESKLSPVKVTQKNIVVRCPWCELKVNKSHYHLYISSEAPIFHCFHCEEKGVLAKLLKFLEGKDLSESFVDEKHLSKEMSLRPDMRSEVYLPDLREFDFKAKASYVQRRLSLDSVSDLKNIKGLVFDVNAFINMNKIVDPSLDRIRDYLHSNFVGFLTEHKTMLVLRNIDQSSDFRYYKIQLRENPFLDYYKIPGGSYSSRRVVISEGLFDILLEHNLDRLELKDKSKLYVACLSKSFTSVLKSITFYEQIFKWHVTILSHKDVLPQEYMQVAEKSKHFIDTMEVYYNKIGKDFGQISIVPYVCGVGGLKVWPKGS